MSHFEKFMTQAHAGSIDLNGAARENLVIETLHQNLENLIDSVEQNIKTYTRAGNTIPKLGVYSKQIETSAAALGVIRNMMVIAGNDISLLKQVTLAAVAFSRNVVKLGDAIDQEMSK